MNNLFIAKALNKLKSLGSQLIGGFLPLEPTLAKFALKPRQLSFETTNICNANCIFCAYQFLKRPKGVMTEEIFKKGIDDFVDIGGGNIGFNPVVGDPLLDPLFLDRIKYARSFGEIDEIGLFTNGIALDRFDVKEILLSGINTIVISFDGFNRDSYARIFGVDKFDLAARNIVKLARTNNELKQPVHIALALRIDRQIREIAQEPDYKTIAALIDDIQYTYMFDSWGGEIKPSDLHGIMGIKKDFSIKTPCSMFYADGPTILVNGDVTVCGCRDLNADKEFYLGNIKNDSLLSLWRSEKLEKMRKGFHKGTVPGICIHCSHYNPVKIFSALRYRKIAEANCKLFYESRYYRQNESTSSHLQP